MNKVERPNARVWGSDAVANLLRALDIDYIALTPGASFRGLHDSLVNFLGNTRPELLLCVHEEHAVALAHGYTRVTGKPMAVALHSNVGLMHATMAIFNAWCDRVPILIIGAQGPIDAVQRRPWVDWIHTATDLGALVRGYTKWDNQPGSVPAALEALVRAHQIAVSEPKGPVYVCLDAGLQEKLLEAPIEFPALERFKPPQPAEPPRDLVAATAALLREAKHPLLMIGRVSPRQPDWDRRVALAEAVNACVLTDIKTGASFPTAHALQPFPPSLYITQDAGALIREADVIVSLDWIDLAGTIRQAGGGQWPSAKVVQCSLDPHLHNGWSMDHQSLPPADLSALASPDLLVERLLEAIGPAARKPLTATARASEPAGPTMVGGRLSIEGMAQITTDTLAAHNPSYMRLPLGWPGSCCRFADPLDYIGFDGGGGIGSGPGMAVGAALALRERGRLPVAILGDGDYLMGLTAIWSAVHYRIPMLVLVANNESFFNDELHQERMAVTRSRPVENRSIGLRMSDPPFDLATLARGQGAVGLGPARSPDELRDALDRGIAETKAGQVCVIDVHVAPEYARAVSSSLLRHIPQEASANS
ncbi:MAG TPA: thiamine pyrophosphate-binding protein [Pseudolabrys sp.]|nr:thiamine pyrophosphate-binding protein [Pseudolabrys sp.]